MSAQQQIVGAAGVGLVVVNVWTRQRQDLAPLFGDTGDLEVAHQTAKKVGGQLIGVTALVLVAGAGPQAGNTACAILACLWILYLTSRPSGSGKSQFFGTRPGASSTPRPAGKVI